MNEVSPIIQEWMKTVKYPDKPATEHILREMSSFEIIEIKENIPAHEQCINNFEREPSTPAKFYKDHKFELGLIIHRPVIKVTDANGSISFVTFETLLTNENKLFEDSEQDKKIFEHIDNMSPQQRNELMKILINEIGQQYQEEFSLDNEPPPTVH